MRAADYHYSGHLTTLAVRQKWLRVGCIERSIDGQGPPQAGLMSRWVSTSDATLQRRRVRTSLIEPAALRGGGLFCLVAEASG